MTQYFLEAKDFVKKLKTEPTFITYNVVIVYSSLWGNCSLTSSHSPRGTHTGASKLRGGGHGTGSASVQRP